MDYQNIAVRILRTLGYASVIAALASPSYAMEHYTRPIQDQNGTAISGATVTVYNSGTTTLATIYSDNGVTAKSNPFTTAIDGLADFYAANGVYDIVIIHSRNLFTPSKTNGVALYDIRDSAVTTFPENPFIGQVVTLLHDGSIGACQPSVEPGSILNLCGWNGDSWIEVGGGGGVTGWPTSSTTKIVTWANSFANSLGIGKDASNYWSLYHDATDGLQFVCVLAGVANDCNYIRKLASGKNFQIQNSSGTSIGTLTESTGAWTNFTIDGEGSGNTITLTEEAWFDVVSCQESTAQHIWDTITATFPAAACDTGTNTQKGYASFDATTDEAIQMNWVLPTGFTGAIDIHFIWKAAATSGATGWCAQLIRVADASTSDPAFPAQAAGNCVSDTAKGTTLQENHATISGVTCTSCAARDHVYVRISRDANGGAVTDDMTGDAHLMKVGRTWRVAK